MIVRRRRAQDKWLHLIVEGGGKTQFNLPLSIFLSVTAVICPVYLAVWHSHMLCLPWWLSHFDIKWLQSWYKLTARSIMQTVSNDMSNDIREAVLRTMILSLKSHVYYTEASCLLSELCHLSLYIYTSIYSYLLIHLSLSSFPLLSAFNNICSFKTSSFHSDSESSIRLYGTEEFTWLILIPYISS